jgi:uncharacterized protein YbjQ (UPF0145 family)
MIDPRFITTANHLEGYRIVSYCGVVRGVIVRSRSAIGNFAAGIQRFIGGNISLYTELCEQARQEAFDLMSQHAAEVGANAIVGMRYEGTTVDAGATEVLCYGTAVVIELEEDHPSDQPKAPEIQAPSA